jgi:small-conductance mechanosensitive channel/CRP-like cAMP-binding protein
MIDTLNGANVTVAAVLIVLLPAFIIAVGELEERLRQRDSSLRASASILRIWVVPLAAIWLLSRTLLNVSSENPLVRLVASALVLSVAAVLLSGFRVVVSRIADRPRRSGERSVPRLLLAVPRLVVLLFSAWLLIAGVWGVDLSAALTALGVSSLVVSFALQDTLGGIASGFTLLADQPFSAGDWIESDDVEGRVVDVNWRSTRVENRDGDLVVIPNGQLAQATIINFDQPSRLHRVMVPVQIERSAPPTAAKAMLLEAARSTAGVVAEPPPFVFVTNIADPIVDYQAYMWVDEYAIVPQVRSDFASLVWYLSYRHGVPLPNPAQDLYVFDGVQSALASTTSSADVRAAMLGSPVLSRVADDVLDRLAAASSIESFQVGEVIIGSGDVRDLFVLDAGTAHLMLHTVDLGDLDVLDHGPGEVLGVLGDLGNAGYRGVVVAASDCRVILIPAQAAAIALTASDLLASALEQIRLSRRRRCERVVRRSLRIADVSAAVSDDHLAAPSTNEDQV